MRFVYHRRRRGSSTTITLPVGSRYASRYRIILSTAIAFTCCSSSSLSSSTCFFCYSYPTVHLTQHRECQSFQSSSNTLLGDKPQRRLRQRRGDHLINRVRIGTSTSPCVLVSSYSTSSSLSSTPSSSTSSNSLTQSTTESSVSNETDLVTILRHSFVDGGETDGILSSQSLTHVMLDPQLDITGVLIPSVLEAVFNYNDSGPPPTTTSTKPTTTPTSTPTTTKTTRNTRNNKKDNVRSNGGGAGAGAVASVMNGLLGSCAMMISLSSSSSSGHFIDQNDDDDLIQKQQQQQEQNPDQHQQQLLLLQRVEQLMNSYVDILEADYGISPDLVSYSLAYMSANWVATTNENLLSFEEERSYATTLANTYMDTMQRQSKKATGSKRRKILVSSKRRSTMTFVQAEPQLKQMIGDDFCVLLETNSYAIIVKPAGVPCYHTKTTTAGKVVNKQKNNNNNNKNKKKKNSIDSSSSSTDISLETAFIHCNVELSTVSSDAMGIVHRLDRPVSGCMIIAKTNDMHAKLVTEFFLRRTTKKYLAVVDSTSTTTPTTPTTDTTAVNFSLTVNHPQQVDDEVDNNNNNSNNSNSDSNSNNNGAFRQRNISNIGRTTRDCIQLVVGEEGVIDSPVNNRPAKSIYRVLKSPVTVDGVNGAAALMEFEIFTGRKHQIRVHAAEVLKCPIWNDPLYGKAHKPTTIDEHSKNKNRDDDDDDDDKKKKMILLHSSELSIPLLGIHSVVSTPPWWDEEEFHQTQE